MSKRDAINLLKHYVSREFTESKSRSLVKYYMNYLSRIGLKSDKVTLDVGSGWGFMSGYYKKNYVGTEIDQNKLLYAKNRFNDKEFLSDNILCLNQEFVSRFEQITLFTVLDEVEDKKRALDNLRQYVTGDGKIYIEVRNKGFFVRKLVRSLGMEKRRRQNAMQRNKPDVDMFIGDYNQLFESTGFKVTGTYCSQRPLHSSSSIQLLKKIIYLCLDRLLPVRYCFMIGFILAPSDNKS